MITSQHLLVTRSWNPPTATPSAPSHSTCWERLAGAEWLDYVSPSDVESLQNVSVYTLYVHIPRKTFPPAALGSELRSCRGTQAPSLCCLGNFGFCRVQGLAVNVHSGSD